MPEKVGLKGITREGMDYEFTLVFDLDIKHNAQASKDRTSLFMDKPAYKLSVETGKIINKIENRYSRGGWKLYAVITYQTDSKTVRQAVYNYKGRYKINQVLRIRYSVNYSEMFTIISTR